MTIPERIAALRQKMKAEGIDTYIVTKFDPHQSEYSAPYWNGVVFITGFTGSAGAAVITQTEAGLWTDGRYYIQAARELTGSGVKLHRAAEPGVKGYLDYAVGVTPKSGTIGFDGRTLSCEALAGKEKGRRIKADKDLLDGLWENRPPLSQNKIYDHLLSYCGKSRQEKIAETREAMIQKGADAYVLSSLDDIAWLLNLRGNDLENVPLFAAYVVLERQKVTLFVDRDKAADVIAALDRDGVSVAAYEDAEAYIRALPDDVKILLCPARTNYALRHSMQDKEIIEIKPDLTTSAKAVKNAVELQNLEKVNVRDGAAMVRFIKWLKENVGKGGLTEYNVEERLIDFRARGENFVFPSFQTIAGYMANAAMMHYSAKPEACAALRSEGLLLVDSGGHYLDGTTDITRTIALGPLTEDMKRDFTLVLRSHIALARAVFLHGATGSHLDVLARLPMWENGLDYKCGTGHGIGFFLNVHEGPQTISPAQNSYKLEPGMIITNEPGIYREDSYGIRTENTLLVKDWQQTDSGRFLCFDTISYCPIDLDALEPALLSGDEKAWLNAYHQKVYDKLSAALDEAERAFLRQATRAV